MGLASPWSQLGAHAISRRDGCCVSRAGPHPQNSVLSRRAERGEELHPQQTDPFPRAAPLQSCLLHTRKCLISLSRGSLICGRNPVLPCLPGISMASCRALRSLRQEGSSGQPRYRQPDKQAAKGPRQITPREDKSQHSGSLGYPRQTL